MRDVTEILFVLCFSFLQVFCADLQEGDSCPLATGAQGLCKYLTDCQPALDTLVKGVFPEICTFNGTNVIICCGKTSPVTKSSPKITLRGDIPPPQIVTEVRTTNRKPGDISKKRCSEYFKLAVDRYQSATLSIGGTRAYPEEFPHMALIGYTQGANVEWSCGGSLISENYVMTASHCLDHRELGLPKLVRVGITDRSDTAIMQERTISEVRYHPDYNSSAKYNDIALLKLSRSFDLHGDVRPACLHIGKEIPPKILIATGWGNLGFAMEGGSNHLYKMLMESFDHAECTASYKRSIATEYTGIKQGILDDLMICAGSRLRIVDTCEGDSGGPLQVYLNETSDGLYLYDIVGVTSFGKPCGLVKNSPGVYTRVSAYIKWIEDVVWPA